MWCPKQSLAKVLLPNTTGISFRCFDPPCQPWLALPVGRSHSANLAEIMLDFVFFPSADCLLSAVGQSLRWDMVGTGMGCELRLASPPGGMQQRRRMEDGYHPKRRFSATTLK